MLVTKRVSFDAAHLLPNYPGKCSNLHGHHWVLEVGYEGHLHDNTGMVVDFVFLKGALQPLVDKLDHSNLNDYEPNPTCENLIERIFEELPKKLEGGANLALIRLWETENSYAEWSLNRPRDQLGRCP